MCVYLEKGGEDERVAEAEHDEGEEGAEAAVEDRRPDQLERQSRALLAAAAQRGELVADVRRVVDGQADAQRHHDRGGDLDGQPEEHHRADQAHQRAHHARDHRRRRHNVADQQRGHRRHSLKCKQII